MERTPHETIRLGIVSALCAIIGIGALSTYLQLSQEITHRSLLLAAAAVLTVLGMRLLEQTTRGFADIRQLLFGYPSKEILLYLPLQMVLTALFLTVLLGPCVMLRYIYPIMLCGPFLVGLLMLPAREVKPMEAAG